MLNICRELDSIAEKLEKTERVLHRQVTIIFDEGVIMKIVDHPKCCMFNEDAIEVHLGDTLETENYHIEFPEPGTVVIKSKIKRAR